MNRPAPAPRRAASARSAIARLATARLAVALVLLGLSVFAAPAMARSSVKRMAQVAPAAETPFAPAPAAASASVSAPSSSAATTAPTATPAAPPAMTAAPGAPVTPIASPPPPTAPSAATASAIAAARAGAASAAASAPPYPLRAAVGDALARNPNIAVAGSERVTAGYLRESAEWGRFPTITAEASPGGYASSQSAGSSRFLRIDQPLWAGGRIDGSIDQAKAQERAAQLGEAESRRAVVEQTAVSYVGWAGAEERLRIAIDGGAIFERLLAYVDRRQQAGAATLSDVTVARARLSAAAAQREQLQGELDRARADLQALVVGQVGRVVPVEVPPYLAGDADTVEQAYLVQSNVAAQRAADVEAARAAVAVKRGQSLPLVSLRVEHQQNGFGGSPVSGNGTRATIALQFTTEPGLAAFSSLHASESRVAAAEEQARVSDVDIRLRARTHVADQQSALRQLADLKPQIDDLQSTADSYLRQFEAGRRSWIEVLNVYRETLDARLSLSRTQTQRDQSAVHLMGNTGGLIPWIDNPPQ